MRVGLCAGGLPNTEWVRGVLSKLTRHSTERGSGLPDSKWVRGQYLKGHGVHIVLRQKTNQINVSLSKMAIQTNAESIPNGPVTLWNVLLEFRFQTVPILIVGTPPEMGLS